MQIDELVQVVQSLNAEDAFQVRFTLEQWRLMAPYLTRLQCAAGDRLITQGETDRAMYLVESGAFQVFREPVQGVPRRVAILRPGAVMGDPSLFVSRPRMAHVDAMTPAIVWGLPAVRFDELALRVPELAVELMRAAGAVMATRLALLLERGAPMA